MYAICDSDLVRQVAQLQRWPRRVAAQESAGGQAQGRGVGSTLCS